MMIGGVASLMAGTKKEENDDEELEDVPEVPPVLGIPDVPEVPPAVREVGETGQLPAPVLCTTVSGKVEDFEPDLATMTTG